MFEKCNDQLKATCFHVWDIVQCGIVHTCVPSECFGRACAYQFNVDI